MEQTTQATTPVKGVDLFGCMVRDPQRSIAFYREVLGIEPTSMDREGRGAEFTLADGSTFGVWQAEESQPVPGAATMFAVDNIHDAVALFRKRGLALSDPMEGGVCFMSFGTDPDGNGVIIHQRKIKD